jgi:hypothetical protein
MKHQLFILLSFFLLTACEKNDVWSKQDDSVNSRESQLKSTLCHYDDSDGWHVISVNSNALPAHLAHGDFLLVDDDGDGWVSAENQCVPGGDCDDNNADVNPGASEACNNEVDDDCDGDIDSADSDCEESGPIDLCAGDVPCCFCPAIAELNITCWNGDPDNPILWDADPTYGICSNCLGDGNCGYLTPSAGQVDSGAPATQACKDYLLAMVVELNLGIGPFCSVGAAPGSTSNSTTNYFGK